MNPLIISTKTDKLFCKDVVLLLLIGTIISNETNHYFLQQYSVFLSCMDTLPTNSVHIIVPKMGKSLLIALNLY